MDTATLFQKFGIALGLGLLIGIQRERSSSALAGFRTFPLVTMLGTLSGLLSLSHGWPVVAAGMMALVALVVISNVAKLRAGQIDPGMTTEVAILMMFALGAYVATGPASVAVVIGATVTLLLHLKPQLHGFAKRIGERDFRAIMLFVAIALVILPVLPDAAFGPYKVLNPQRIWWMVVLITGISLGGYLIYKAFDQTTGAVAGGVLGGLISSTATTVSYARRTREQPGSEAPAALVIVLAGAVVFARVLVTVAVAAPSQLQAIAPSVSIMLGMMTILAFFLWWRTRGDRAKLPEQANPTELKSAIVFALLFAGVLLAVAAAKNHFGDRGLYPVAILSGLTDMDAITLTSAEMARDSRVEPRIAARLIIIASLANMVFKAGMVAALGSRALFTRVAIVFGIALVGGGALLWLF